MQIPFRGNDLLLDFPYSCPAAYLAPLTIVQPGMAAKFSGELEDFFAGKAKIMVGPVDSGVSSA